MLTNLSHSLQHNTMMKFVIFLAVSVMWCGCDPLEGVDNCEQLKECSLTGNVSVNKPFTPENYENSCRRLANFSVCVESGNLTCSILETRRNYELDLKEAQIICSPEGKEVYLDAAIIECLQNNAADLKRGVDRCRNSTDEQAYEAARVYSLTNKDPEPLHYYCRFWEQNVNCIRQLYTANCGEKMGALIAKRAQIIGEVYEVC